MGGGFRMSMDGSCDLTWGGEEYRFRLRVKHLKEIHKAVTASRGGNLGAKTFLAELETFEAWPHEVREVLRQGLIGADYSSDEVGRIMERHFDSFPPFESYPHAKAVFFAGMCGDPTDLVGKKEQAERAKMKATTMASSSPQYTASEPFSDGHPGRSTS